MTRAEWLEARRKGIGASDAAAVCGISPWATPLHVYCDKIGETQSPEPDDGPLYWGLRLENLIAEEYQRRTGRELMLPPASLRRHRERPWQIATPDRIAVDGRLVELKTSRLGTGFGSEWTDEIPERYAIQVTHQMIVTGALTADVAVLIGGSDFRVYTVEFNPQLAAALTRIEADFWTRVERREPPEPDWQHPDTPKLIAMLHEDGRTVDLDEEAAYLARRYLELGRVKSSCEHERALIKKDLFGRIGGPGIGALPNGLGEVEWKKITIRKRAVEAHTEEQNRLNVNLEE